MKLLIKIMFLKNLQLKNMETHLNKTKWLLLMMLKDMIGEHLSQKINLVKMMINND